MVKSRADIEADVRDVLVDALGVDEDDVVPTATLKGDLGAESIDYLDIVFRLEKKFTTAEKPFKIAQGELFPENLMTDPSLVGLADSCRRGSHRSSAESLRKVWCGDRVLSLLDLRLWNLDSDRVLRRVAGVRSAWSKPRPPVCAIRRMSYRDVRVRRAARRVVPDGGTADRR